MTVLFLQCENNMDIFHLGINFITGILKNRSKISLTLSEIPWTGNFQLSSEKGSILSSGIS